MGQKPGGKGGGEGISGVLGYVFAQNDVGEVYGSLDVAVVRAWHCAVDRLVWASDERLVAFNVLRDIRRGVAQRLLGEDPKAPVFIDGKLFKTLRGPDLMEDFLGILDHYVEERFGT